MKTKKLTIELTPLQLADVIACVNFALRQVGAYGHVTIQEQGIRERHRRKTLEVLTKVSTTEG